MSEAVGRESALCRFAMRVLSLFDGLAAMLAIVGLIGVVWLVVATRRRELGVRADLGATPNYSREYVLVDVFWTTTAATSIGVAGALALGRFLEGVLVGPSAYDPVSLVVVAAITLSGAAVLASLRQKGPLAPVPLRLSESEPELRGRLRQIPPETIHDRERPVVLASARALAGVPLSYTELVCDRSRFTA